MRYSTKKIQNKTYPPTNWTGDRVRHLRESLGWSKLRLARELGYAQSGRGQASPVVFLESGRTQATGPLCRLLDVLEQNRHIPTNQNIEGEHEKHRRTSF